ncbi:hypothetical protein GCM10010912_40370 [Paenibacillus albidus]|uniref:LamG-like jellyroll fold domain-containing protein n=1 Tax=Paenibacillus albidus TaxID=2041023 RepID=A0A917CKI3_9BACL|nr:DUF5695 domain-containing protein [Paenibacillus albidus]GGF91253.1 hypothetical protein GCM10010912_40370 [Paenibacillus albidus]
MSGNIQVFFKKRTLLSTAIIATALGFLSFAQPVSAYTLSNNTFNISTGANGDISSLKLTGDNFPTNYVMNSSNAPNQNTSDHQWLGELMFTYRLNNGAWTKAWTSKSADARTQSQSGNTVNITYQNSANSEGIRNFRVNESYSLVSDYLLWSIQVTNTSNQTLEIGDFGLPLPFNEFWTGGGDEQIYETRVVTQSFIGNNSSYVTAQRPSGIGPSLLLVPDASTGAGFEYMDNWRTQDHPGSKWAGDQGGWVEGLSVYYIHSNVIKSTGRGYLPSSSLTLAPGASKTYAFKFFKSPNEQALQDKLYSEGLVDVSVVPGMIVPTDQTAKFDLRTSKEVTSVTAQYPNETTLTSLGNTAGDHNLYSLKMNRLGPNNITVNYGDNEKTVLQFYAIEPVDAALQRHATFMVNHQQWNVPGDIRDKVFDDWMMQNNAKRNNFAGYWGWGDDWGYTHGQFLAEKNVQKPVASEITAVDKYLETAIWGTLMADHHTDYLIPDFLMAPPNTTPTYRGYAYPHIYNTYFSMYKISKLYPGLVTYSQPSSTYLLRAYNIMKALYDGPVAYNWNTGLMGEVTTPEIIKALQDEGFTSQANDIIAKMNTKYNNFSNTTYPYGSEYNYDNTGEEAVYMLAKMKNNTTIKSKINTKTRAVRGKMPVWYYHSDPVTINGEPWWQFQYTASLAGTAMDDWVRNHSASPEYEQRLTYAAKLANLSAINSGQISPDPADIGAVSWTYQAMKGNHGALGLDNGPLFNGWRGMSGEADLGLFGAIKLLSSDVAVDPIFGVYGYGCDVTDNGTSYVVTPKDGVFQRLNLITEKWGMELGRDRYTSATVAKAKNSANFTLSNATPGTAHSTMVTFTGMAPGTYNVTVNNVASGSFTVVSGQPAKANLNIGTAASYAIKVQQGTVAPSPSIIVKYNMNQSSGATVSDSSGSNNHAALTGTTSWGGGRSGAGNALNLSGTSAYASLPAGVVSQLNDFTVSAWVRITANSDWSRIFDFGTGTDSYMFLAPQSGDGGGMRFAITSEGNGSEQQLTSSSPLVTGQWKHVAVTMSGNTGRMYVDGVQVAVNTGMTLKPSSLGSTSQNYIGKSQYDDPNLDGAVDDFIIYSRALSASEITALFGGNQPLDIPSEEDSLIQPESSETTEAPETPETPETPQDSIDHP